MFWHERVRFRGRLGQYTDNGKARLLVQRSEANPETFEAYFERKEAEGIEYPEGWAQLWPREPITGPTAQNVLEDALPLLNVVASSTKDEDFEIRSCPVPIHCKQVKEVPSATYRVKSLIYKHTETRYEVRYFGAVVGCDWEDGWRLAVPEGEGDKTPANFELLTFSDSLEGAEQVAMAEMERIVAGGEIKPR